MPEPRFTWVPFVEELATKLLQYQSDRRPLVQLLVDLEAAGVPMRLLGSWRADLDPFTFFATLNRSLRLTWRHKIALRFKQFFGILADVPGDFDGVPTAPNQRARLVGDAPAECDLLWGVFRLALQNQPLSDPAFLEAVDAARALNGVANNLYTALFWIRPHVFVPADAHTRGALSEVYELPDSASAAEYAQYVAAARAHYPDIIQLSADVWAAPATSDDDTASEVTALPEWPDQPCYWFVGSMWNGSVDKTAEFVAEGVWRNHWGSGVDPNHPDYTKLMAMRPGERIAIKASYVRRHGLPFATTGKPASVMRIKATGTIVHNPNDGISVDVKWDPLPADLREWYFYTNRTTIWRVGPNLDVMAYGLVQFAFWGAPQDLNLFLSHPYWGANYRPLHATNQPAATEPDRSSDAMEVLAQDPAGELPVYTIESAKAEGVFVPAEQLEAMVVALQERKNIILQGPPGVGKTFIADKLAYLLIGQSRTDRVLRVQFHPSMSYEDFVQGLQPKDGSWRLTAGKFMEAVERACLEPSAPFVLIVEEINRGNPSAIFGELLTLLECDKRGPKYAIHLRGSPSDGEVWLPPSLYVIGTMNRADRSLVPLDAALRRRFAFFAVEPNFGVELEAHCSREWCGPSAELTALLGRVLAVNDLIAADPNLGRDALIGHSYFCRPPKGADVAALEEWFRAICDQDLIPLLQEHWFTAADRPRLQAAIAKLLGTHGNQ